MTTPALEIDPDALLYTAGIALVVSCAVLFAFHALGPKGQESK